MSYQQINLYQPIFRTQKKIFSARTMLEATVVVIVGLALFSGYALWQGRQIAAQHTQLENRRVEALTRIEQMRALFPQRVGNAALEQEVAHLRKELEGRQRIVAHLAATDAGNLEGFAPHLEGLARQKPASLWLTDVVVSKGGAEMVLRGNSLQAEQVPRYLQRLAAESAFAGREFGNLQIARPEQGPAHYEFIVSTRALDENEGNRP